MSDLLDLCNPAATTQLSPCAEVRVGDRVTRYVRRGSGSPVVLVGANTDESPVWRPLVDALVAHHRVVAPQAPPSGVDDTEWLRGFIEGLGLSSVALITGDAACAAALELVAADDFTIRKLVVVHGAERSNGNGNGAAAAPQPAASRTLWVSGTWPPEDAVRRIEQFIAEPTAT